MNEMEAIQRFNDDNAPFYLVDLKTGRYSLCLDLRYMPEEYRDFGRTAFNRYHGKADDYVNHYGMFSRGQEWETVFKKAFGMDAIRRISFASENDVFICETDDLNLLKEIGGKFKTMCDDTERFTALVSNAMAEAKYEQEQSAFAGMTVRELLQDHPGLTLDLMTPGGIAQVTAEYAQTLLEGGKLFIHPGNPAYGFEIDGEEILNQEIIGGNYDVRRRYISVMTDVPKEEMDFVPNTAVKGHDAAMQMGGLQFG